MIEWDKAASGSAVGRIGRERDGASRLLLLVEGFLEVPHGFVKGGLDLLHCSIIQPGRVHGPCPVVGRWPLLMLPQDSLMYGRPLPVHCVGHLW